jgi:hypothetical protein
VTTPAAQEAEDWPMNKLKNAWLAVLQGIKQICSIPQTIANARQQKRQQQVDLREFETDRLDRLRNPSKYEGK